MNQVDIVFEKQKRIQKGESYGSILKLMLPEFVTALVLYSMPFFIDSYFIGSLASTAAYTALTGSNNLLHLFIKIAEGFSVGTVIVAGMFNGAQQYEKVGRAVKDSFWITSLLGTIFSGVLFFGSRMICTYYSIPDDVLSCAVPYMRLRAVGIFLTFVSLAFLGFLRSVKNTRTPMKIFISGALLFVGLDYCLIYGACGMPALGLMGSAWATIGQYVWILLLSVSYALFNKKNIKYKLRLFKNSRGPRYYQKLVWVSLPVIIDKSLMAIAYIWLGAMINQLGSSAAAAFGLLKDMERFAFLPAVACAQVVTFLVSNEMGRKDWDAAMANVRRLTWVAAMGVFTLLLIFYVKIHILAGWFDRVGDFSHIVERSFPLISILVVCDLLQLILSGALRGAGKTTAVMMVRAIVCLFYFMPVSFLLRHMTLHDCTAKLTLIYGSFYIGNGIMSLAYLYFLGNPFINQKSVSMRDD